MTKKNGDVWWNHFLSGEVAGMIGAFFCHPFDTAKTLMQLHPQKHKSTFGVIRNLYVERGGLPAIWRGVLFPMTGFGVIFSTAFGVYGCSMDAVRSATGKEPHLGYRILCGSAAGWTSSIPRVFVERIKVYAQASEKNSIAVFKELYRKHGIRNGFFCGMSATQIREVAQFSLYYPIYEGTLDFLEPGCTCKADHTQKAFWFSGASAGVLTWIASYPSDVIKTTTQANPAGTYKNFLDCGKHIYRESGIFGFWRGIVPTCIRATVLHSTIFVVFENVHIRVKKYIERNNDEPHYI